MVSIYWYLPNIKYYEGYKNEFGCDIRMDMQRYEDYQNI